MSRFWRSESASAKTVVSQPCLVAQASILRALKQGILPAHANEKQTGSLHHKANGAAFDQLPPRIASIHWWESDRQILTPSDYNHIYEKNRFKPFSFAPRQISRISSLIWP
jgi:hypothetical protein